MYIALGVATSLKDLAQQLGMTEKSVGNVVRDLVNFGLIQRHGDTVSSISEFSLIGSAHNIIERLDLVFAPAFRILQSHAFVVTLRSIYLDSTQLFDEVALEHALHQAMPSVVYRDRTWRSYAVRLAKYMSGVGILERHGNQWSLVEDPKLSIH